MSQHFIIESRTQDVKKYIAKNRTRRVFSKKINRSKLKSTAKMLRTLLRLMVQEDELVHGLEDRLRELLNQNTVVPFEAASSLFFLSRHPELLEENTHIPIPYKIRLSVATFKLNHSTEKMGIDDIWLHVKKCDACLGTYAKVTGGRLPL